MSSPPIELLQTLAIVAGSPNLRAAAAELGLSQPAVSFQLKKLQTRAPLPLFSQEGKRKVLTRYGRELATLARKELASLDAAVEGLHRRYLAPEKLTLKIGARRETFLRVASALRFPGALLFQNMSTDRALEKLSHHRVDIAISHRVPELPGFTARKLFTNGVRLVAHRKWLPKGKLDAATARSPELLLQVPALAYRSSLPFLSPWLRHCELEPSQLKPRFICEDWNTIMRFIEQGAGYSLVPTDIAVSEGANVAAYDIPERAVPSVTYYAIYDLHLTRIPAFRGLLGPRQQ